MNHVLVRSAQPADILTIRSLLQTVMGDRENMLPEQFLIAEDEDELVACGRLKPHKQVTELTSLTVHPEYQGEGIATRIIKRLVASHKKGPPIYVICPDETLGFFEQIGFTLLQPHHVPPELTSKCYDVNILYGSSSCLILEGKRWQEVVGG